MESEDFIKWVSSIAMPFGIEPTVDELVQIWTTSKTFAVPYSYSE